MSSRFLSAVLVTLLYFVVSCKEDEGALLLVSPIETRPSTVMKGDSVGITGEEFFWQVKGFSVMIGGVAIKSFIATATEIRIKIPDSMGFGQQEVSVARDGYRTATSAIFVSKYPVPIITRIKPEVGSVGTLVTIYGENLGVDINASKLAFSDAQGQPLYLSYDISSVAPFTPLLSSNTDSIQVKVPPGASSGPIYIWILPNPNLEPNYLLSVHSPDLTIAP